MFKKKINLEKLLKVHGSHECKFHAVNVHYVVVLCMVCSCENSL